MFVLTVFFFVLLFDCGVIKPQKKNIWSGTSIRVEQNDLISIWTVVN